MKVGDSHEVPMSTCPWCGTDLDRAASVESDSRLEAGDVTVCLRCAGVLVFTNDLAVRKATGEELRECGLDPRIRKIQHVIRTMHEDPNQEVTP